MKQGLSASSLLDRGLELMGETNRYYIHFICFVIFLGVHVIIFSCSQMHHCFFPAAIPPVFNNLYVMHNKGCALLLPSTPYTPLDKRAMENTDEDTTTDDWTLEQPLAQTRTTAIVEVKGAVNVVLTPLVAESLDR